jgi:hypothetical protein
MNFAKGEELGSDPGGAGAAGFPIKPIPLGVN